MPYNGSGAFTLAEAAFVPNTPISSAAVNSDLSDIATNGLSNAVTKDGQTTITGPFKGANGSVGAPMYSFASDTNSGMYRIAADNIGISVGGTKILDIAATGLSVVGTVSPSTTVTNAVGTALLPSYTFVGDLDSGMYWIGANNIGVGVNGAKVLDISTGGLNVIGVVSANGAAFSPTAQGAGMVNGTIVASVAGNALTFAIKTLAGADPSATDPVFFSFRSATAATGTYTTIQLTAAHSLVISSGSTLGTSSSNIPFRIWLVMFNDGGTLRLGVINCLSSKTIYPLAGFEVASSTAEGGAGGADSAQVFYTGTAVTSKAYSIIAYASYETGVTTAGAWAAVPTRLQLYGINVPAPGDTVQMQQLIDGALGTGSTALPIDDTIPQSGEGTQFMAQAITPNSASNLLEISHTGVYSAAVAADCGVALFQDATANSLAAMLDQIAGVNLATISHLEWTMIAATTSSTTFKIRAGNTAGNTITYNGSNAGRKFGGVMASTLRITEVMA